MQNVGPQSFPSKFDGLLVVGLVTPSISMIELTPLYEFWMIFIFMMTCKAFEIQPEYLESSWSFYWLVCNPTL
jgi:hypothetical protein